MHLFSRVINLSNGKWSGYVLAEGRNIYLKINENECVSKMHAYTVVHVLNRTGRWMHWMASAVRENESIQCENDAYKPDKST